MTKLAQSIVIKMKSRLMLVTFVEFFCVSNNVLNEIFYRQNTRRGSRAFEFCNPTLNTPHIFFDAILSCIQIGLVKLVNTFWCILSNNSIILLSPTSFYPKINLADGIGSSQPCLKQGHNCITLLFVKIRSILVMFQSMQERSSSTNEL